MREFSKFLSAQRDFQFHIDDYLRALRRLQYIERRLRRFVEFQATGEQRLYESLFLRYFSRIKRKVPAFNNIADVLNFSQIPPSRIKGDISSYIPCGNFHANTIWKKTTSGSTGRPVDIFFSELFYLTELFTMHRKIESFLGIMKNRPFIFLGVINSTTWGDFVLPDLFDQNKLFGRASFDERDSESILALWRKIYLARPEILAMKADYLRLFLRTWEPSWGKPPFRAISISGAPCIHTDREEAIHLWGVQIVDVYAATELGAIAFKGHNCIAHHVDGSSIFVEVIGDLLSSNGVLTYSSVSNSMFPLFRYQSGDTGSLISDICPCGRRSQLIQIEYKQKYGLIELSSRNFFDLSRLNALYGASKDILRVSPINLGNSHIIINVFTNNNDVIIEQKLGDITKKLVPSGLTYQINYKEI